jgi:transposase
MSNRIHLIDLDEYERIWIFIRREGWTRKQAAEHLDYSFWTVRNWYNYKGKPPGVPLGHITQGEVLYVIRRRHGLTLERLAEESGLSSSYVSDCEWDRSPNAHELLLFWNLL